MSDCKSHKLLTSPSFQTKQSQETQSVHRMIQMLKNYEENCLKRGNFFEAEASKLRIGQLKHQQLKFEHEELKIKNKENIQEVDRRNEQEIALFHETWEERIKQNLEGYKLLQQKMKEDHARELEEFQIKISAEQPSKIKYSTTVLKMRNHLENLIKCRSYIEADYVSKQLQILEQQQNQTWIIKFQEKKKKQFQQVIKKQEVEMKALKVKIKTMFNQKIKEKEELFNKLLNKIQKRKVQSGKFPIELKLKEHKLLRTSLNMSRSSSQNRRSLYESRNKSFLSKQ